MDFTKWEKRAVKLPNLAFPKMNQTTTHFYKDGKLIATIKPSGVIVIPDEAEFAGIDVASIDRNYLNRYTIAREDIVKEGILEAARATRDKFYKELKETMLEDIGIPLNHPKADLLWEMARNSPVSDNVRTRGIRGLYDNVKKLSMLLS